MNPPAEAILLPRPILNPGPTADGPTAPTAPAWESSVRLAQAGDRDAFAALVDEFGPRVLGYLNRFASTPHDAEDLTQDTLLKAFRTLPSLTAPRAFPAWLFTIARRTALNHRRDTRPTEPLTAEHLDPEPDSASTVASRDAWNRLWQDARQHLKPAQYETLWLRYAEELSVRDIARITRRNPIHVRVLLHRGRHALLQLAAQHRTQPQERP